MSDVTRILSQINDGDPSAAEQLLPLVYEELRKLAAAKMAQEKPGQTLQATALVHEAYLRLVGKRDSQHWESRGHFFAAAAEAMRRILVDRAGTAKRLKRGGGRQRVDFSPHRDCAWIRRKMTCWRWTKRLSSLRPTTKLGANLVKLRFFAGLDVATGGRVAGRGPPHRRPPLGLRTGLALPATGESEPSHRRRSSGRILKNVGALRGSDRRID